MKTFILAAAVALIFSVNALSQQKCKEYTVPKSIFAFCPPADWIGTREKGEKHLTFNKKVPESQFPPTIMIKEDILPGPSALMTFGMIQGFFKPNDFTNKSLVDMKDFQTASGLKGTRFVFQFDLKPFHMRQIWYVFEGTNDVKLTFIVMAPSDEPTSEAEAETAIKTIRIN